MNLSGSKTERNLLKTFANEARTLTKYSLFAEKALEEGLNDVAEDLMEIAKEEFGHAREAFKRYLKLVKTTNENLGSAIKDEDEDSNDLYMKFHKEALEEGFEDIANFYKQLMNVEKQHSKTLKESKYDIKDDNMDKATWKCLNCGNVVNSREMPEYCKLCKHSNDHIVRDDEEDYDDDDYDSDDYRYPKRRPRRRRRPNYRPNNWWWNPFFRPPFWFHGGFYREDTNENNMRFDDSVFWG